ncbi:LysR family transcriptional regulator [Roseomonas gilardii]|uniref:LysR family transcriptional regulator n=1 Tax=Roseomonas gilardii TaxID=257708 RepID=UPI0011A4AD48|nr:LysR family transcriptional regulator [Roseomonas gilardii]
MPGLSVSAISHAVRRLERSLGLQLLARTTRSVAVTEAGRRLLNGLVPALAGTEDALEQATAGEARLSGQLRLSVPRSAAELVVVPLALRFTERHPDVVVPLALRFTERHPDVVVEVIAEEGLTDIVAAGFDAGVRFGESLAQDMIAVPIGPPQRMAVVAAPGYFAGRPVPETPRDLAGHAAILRRFAGGGLYRWEFERDGTALEVSMRGPLVLNDDALIRQAALAGAGLACVFEAQVAEDLREGRLLRVLEAWCPPFPGFFLYYPNRDPMRPLLRAFIDAAQSRRDRPAPPLSGSQPA